MKPNRFFMQLEEVGVELTEEVMELQWDFELMSVYAFPHSVVARCLDWPNTPQGGDYWANISSKLRRRVYE